MATLTWIARIAGTLMVLFVIAFAFAQIERPVFVFGMVSLYGGLLLAWRYPLAGGLTSLAGWLLTSASWDWPFVVPAAIGLLHILTAWRRAKPLRRVPAWIAIPAAIFTLLAANEMFGMPPLMTPGVDLSGTWRDAATAFTIHADQSVTGVINGVPVVNAKATGNRSWFGRLLHWRTEYLIQGTFEGKRFTAPLDPSGPDLRGSLFLGKPAGPRSLHLTREN